MQDSHGKFTCLCPSYDPLERYADRLESEISEKILVRVSDIGAAMADLDSMGLTRPCWH
jgi:Rad3-related DNA helicase